MKKIIFIWVVSIFLLTIFLISFIKAQDQEFFPANFGDSQFIAFNTVSTAEDTNSTIVNVSGNETGGTTPPTTPPSGGGGGVINVPSFTVDKDHIKVSLSQGQVKTENITITNTGTQTETIQINNLLTDFIIRGEDLISLEPGESKTIPLYIFARVTITPDLYLGKIVISSGNVKKEILIAIEVQSAGTLLDVSVKIQPNYKNIIPGSSIFADINLFNLGTEGGRKDIALEYIVKNYDNKTIISTSESLAIETQVNLIKEITIPDDAELGDYVLYVRAIYNGKIASSSDDFKVVSLIVTPTEKIYIVTIIILLVILGILIYYITEHRKTHQKKYKKEKTKKIGLEKLIKK